MIEIFQKSRTYLSAATGDKLGYYLAVAAFFAGILMIGLIDYFVPSTEGDIGNLNEKDSRSIALKRMGFMTALAIGIHNFPDEFDALMLTNALITKNYLHFDAILTIQMRITSIRR